MKQSSPSSYTRNAKFLYWVMAVPIMVLPLLGEHTMGDDGARLLPTVRASAGLVLLGDVIKALLAALGVAAALKP